MLRGQENDRAPAMTKTLDLLDRAIARFKSERATSLALGLGATTLGAARSRGHLSPTVAGVIAQELGEDEMFWIALAAVEGERPSAQRDRLARSAMNWRKR